MCQNSGLAQALVRDRVAELHRAAAANGGSQGARRRQLVAAPRNATGWLLVDLGLRLAAPRHALNHHVVRGPQ
jgi:hypothetical protein